MNSNWMLMKELSKEPCLLMMMMALDSVTNDKLGYYSVMGLLKYLETVVI